MRALSLTIAADAAAAAAEVADMIAAVIRQRPDAVLGLATGGTMEAVYAALVRAHRDGLSFARVTTVNLDEYVGLGAGHPNSYRSYMAAQLFDQTDLDPARTHLPDGMAEPEAAARAYAALLDRIGPPDLQLLGIGVNGHIGFNEPGTPVDAPTRVVRLSPETLAANRRYFPPGAAMPDRAVTMGTAAILSARRLVLLATGKAKAGALAAALDGPVGADCPASWLRLHRDCRVIADPAASAALLTTAPPTAVSQAPAAGQGEGTGHHKTIA